MTIAVCLGLDVLWAHPAWGSLLLGFIPNAELFPVRSMLAAAGQFVSPGTITAGLIPSGQIVVNTDMLYIAMGIIGATVMPHNLYLHSSLAQTRAYEETPRGKREAIMFSGIDSMIALTFAFLVNAAILVLAAAAFHAAGMVVDDISVAYELLAPVLGASAASILFAVALLASGQNSTVTGTMAGQIIMEGFLNIRLQPWLRRIITRGLAIFPALLFIFLFGSQDVTKLLVLSQVVLSIQLPFAMIPLVLFTSSRKRMGEFVNSMPIVVAASVVAAVITSLNVWLVWNVLS
jgi:manganese transport protein